MDSGGAADNAPPAPQMDRTMEKSSVDEIRTRFDGLVERFSNLETGQPTAIDGGLGLSLIAEAAARTTPDATRILDVGCGAGNFTLRLRENLPFRHATLVDLSLPMLTRARERIAAAGVEVEMHHRDVREADFPEASFDIIVAAAVLHHLREEAEWEAVYRNLSRWLRPGGALWIFDLMAHEIPAVEAMQRERYAEYLRSVGGEEYAVGLLAYSDREDSPRPLAYQLDLMRANGFTQIDVLLKNAAFAAFGGVRE